MTSGYTRSLALAALLVGSNLSMRTQAQAQPAADAQAAPATAPPAAPAGAASPAAYPYPPPYGYPPGHGYPYGYPPPAYPPYSQGAPTYPAAYAANPPAYPAPAAPPPAPLPSGKWRLGASLLLVPQGYLSYDLRYRGESQLTYARGTTTSAAVAVFTEFDLIRHLYLGMTLQFTPSVKWEPPPASSTQTSAFSGSGQELDLFPQIGASLSATPRLRVMAFVAPGYSLLFASGMADAFANTGTAHGFALQTGGGVLYALGEHGFFTIRGSYQWTFPNSQVHSNTTGESADAHFRFQFIALHGAAGYWF